MNKEIKNTHSLLVSELLKQGYSISQGPFVVVHREDNKSLLYTSESKYNTSILDVLVENPIEVQREKYRGERGWITDITNKMVYIKLESGKTVRISKTSLGIETCNTPSPRRSPREHTATKSPKTPIDVRKLTFVEEVEDECIRCIEEDTEDNVNVGGPAIIPIKKEVTYSESVISGIVEALGKLWPLSQ